MPLLLASITHDTESVWKVRYRAGETPVKLIPPLSWTRRRICGKVKLLPMFTYLTCTFELKKKKKFRALFHPLRRLFIHRKKRKKNESPIAAIQQLSSFLCYHHPPALRRAAQTVIDLAWSLPLSPPSPTPPTPSAPTPPPPLVMNMRRAAPHRFLN